jgi:hypothetical protein
MPKRLCLSVVIELPDDPFEASGTYALLHQPWTTLLADLAKGGMKHEAKADEMEIRKPVVRRPRKPRLVTPPEQAA